VAGTVGSPTRTGWKRRSKAGSFSTCCLREGGREGGRNGGKMSEGTEGRQKGREGGREG